MEYLYRCSNCRQYFTDISAEDSENIDEKSSYSKDVKCPHCKKVSKILDFSLHENEWYFTDYSAEILKSMEDCKINSL